MFSMDKIQNHWFIYVKQLICKTIEAITFWSAKHEIRGKCWSIPVLKRVHPVLKVMKSCNLWPELVKDHNTINFILFWFLKNYLIFYLWLNFLENIYSVLDPYQIYEKYKVKLQIALYNFIKIQSYNFNLK